jgi:hypothetical protein
MSVNSNVQKAETINAEDVEPPPVPESPPPSPPSDDFLTPPCTPPDSPSTSNKHGGGIGSPKDEKGRKKYEAEEKTRREREDKERAEIESMLKAELEAQVQTERTAAEKAAWEAKNRAHRESCFVEATPDVLTFGPESNPVPVDTVLTQKIGLRIKTGVRVSSVKFQLRLPSDVDRYKFTASIMDGVIKSGKIVEICQ